MKSKSIPRAAAFLCAAEMLFAVSCSGGAKATLPPSSNISSVIESTPSTAGTSLKTTAVTAPESTSPVSETSPETETPAPVCRDRSPLAEERYMPSFEKLSYERSEKIEYIMLHFSSNVLKKPEDPFDIEDMVGVYAGWESSTHYVIDREGRIYCFVPEYRCAWHAGKGTWRDDERLTDRMNYYSIGIEILAIGSQSDMSIYMSARRYKKIPKEFIGYTDAQYDALSALLIDLCDQYGIPADRDHILGHEEYAPDRKNDPGELFDWSRIPVTP